MIDQTALEIPVVEPRAVPRSRPIHCQLADDETTRSFAIGGVKFQPTNCEPLDPHDGYGASRVIRTSEGPGITDYVTHQADFEYSTFGIHAGQDDRLTFMGSGPAITAHLIDCRIGSASAGCEITIGFRPSPLRVLTIPAGVAHTFDGLAGVVTRDEPVWYADSNPDWEPDNDLISFPRTATTAPLVRANRHLLPVAAHLVLSRMSQAANAANHAAYSARYRVNIAGETRYLKVTPPWSTTTDLDEWVGLPVQAELGNFTLTGSSSFTIVPSTDSCTSDVIEVRGEGTESTRFVSHRRSERRLTWLGGSGDSWISFGDAGNGVVTRRFDDPRITIRIPPGVKYRVRCAGLNWYRSEMRLLEVEGAATPPGRDMQTHRVEDVRPEPIPGAPYVPGAALNALARAEAAASKYLTTNRGAQ